MSQDSPSRPAPKRRRVGADGPVSNPASAPENRNVTPDLIRQQDRNGGDPHLHSPSPRRSRPSTIRKSARTPNIREQEFLATTPDLLSGPSLSSKKLTSALQKSAVKRAREVNSKSASNTPLTATAGRNGRLNPDSATISRSGRKGGSTLTSTPTFEITANEEDNVFFSRPTPPSIRPSKPATPPATAPLDGDSAMAVIRRHVLAKLARRSPVRLRGLDDQFNSLYQVVEQAVASGESNTIVVTGPRGSGKSALVKSVLHQLRGEYGPDSFYTVSLDGLIHTDDKLALREIWRQLGRELDPDDENDGLGGSYADTMAKLLATLSHPDEQGMGGAEGEGESENHFGSTTATAATARSVVFVLSEFHRFTTHPRQTLLYNLFDIAQSRKAPIAVLGLTTRVSLVESFEKRVKSRFSHRYVHVRPPMSVTDAGEICRAALTVLPEELSVSDRSEIAGDWQQPLSWWSTCIDTLLGSHPFLARYIHPIFCRTKSVSALFNALILPISTIRHLPDTTAELIRHMILNPFISLPDDPTGRSILAPPDSKLSALSSLSDVQLGLLIAACRLDAIHNAAACNFNMAYWEYVNLAGQAKVAHSVSGLAAIGAGASTRVWGREVAQLAWEGLASAGLLVPANASAGGGRLGGSGMSGKGALAAADGLGIGLLRPDIGLEEIPDYVPDIDRVFEKWCRQI